MISFSHVSFAKGKNLLLNDISFDVTPGEFVCIVGPRGSGKTALLELLLALEKPSRGIVSVDDTDLQSLPPKFLQFYRRSIGYVSQKDLFLREQTIASNIAFPLRLQRRKKAEVTKRTVEKLREMDLLEQAVSLPLTLPLYERRKAALARALIGEPSILLADGIADDLDEQSTQEILRHLRECNRKGTTVVLATSQETLAANLETRVIRIAQGKLMRDTKKNVPLIRPKVAPLHPRITPISV